MSVFNNLRSVSHAGSAIKKKKAGVTTEKVDPLQGQRDRLSSSIIPGRSRLTSMSAESAGATQSLGAFNSGSQTTGFQAEDEEAQTGRRFNREIANGFSRQRIQSRQARTGSF